MFYAIMTVILWRKAMNNKLFLPIFIALGLAIPMHSMELKPGTVIGPMHQTGQFTAAGINPVHQTSGLVPAITTIGQTGSQIAQPTLISFAAGKAPWWALSAGTGYLLLFKSDIYNPALLSSCVAGAGFASGSQASQLFKNISSNPTITTAARAAAIAGCVGLSYSTNVTLAQDAFFAMAQAIGIDATLELVDTLLTCAQGSPTEKQQQSSYTVPTWAAQATAQGAEIGLQTAFIQLLHNYDPVTLLRIFLYEQTYRLAQKGYDSANQLMQFIKKNYKPLDPKKAACSLI